MKLAALNGTTVHAPEGTRTAYLSAYTGGADVMHIPVRLTKDDYLVVVADDNALRLTEQSVVIADASLGELRKLDWGATFHEADGAPFRYPARLETLPMLLDALAVDSAFVIELRGPEERILALFERATAACRNRGLLARTVFVVPSATAAAMARARATDVQLAVIVDDAAGVAALETSAVGALAAVVIPLAVVLEADGTTTDVGRAVERLFRSGQLALGAIARDDGRSLRSAAIAAARECGFVWALATGSMPAAAEASGRGWKWIDETFSQDATKHDDVNADLWHLGYAKNSPYCHVYPDRGIHIDICPYDGAVSVPPMNDPVRDALQRLTERSWEALRDWPFYAGGGVGFNVGIVGDFAAEVDVESKTALQATTVEMAILNVDPATHRKPWREDGTPNHTTSFRDKHSFFDPHGAPPYVGVEHDEDDGWRINWNLGTDYDANQYGKAFGDGKQLKGRMRLERRGNHFSAWYRGVGKERALDWVCLGAVRNDSMNAKVFLRCVGKRWRQEDPNDPSRWMDVIPNHFTFTNLTITRFT
jgi:glycerophosphoryl diester phosphodiesterase